MPEIELVEDEPEEIKEHTAKEDKDQKNKHGAFGKLQPALRVSQAAAIDEMRKLLSDQGASKASKY